MKISHDFAPQVYMFLYFIKIQVNIRLIFLNAVDINVFHLYCWSNIKEII